MHWTGRVQECDPPGTPAALPAAVRSQGEAWAAGRAGFRAEVAASIPCPWLGGGGRKQRCQASEQTRDPSPAGPLQGPRPSLFPRAKLGITEPVNPMPGAGGGAGPDLSLTFQIRGWVCAVGTEAARDPLPRTTHPPPGLSPHFNFLPGTPPPTSPCYLLL